MKTTLPISYVCLASLIVTGCSSALNTQSNHKPMNSTNVATSRPSIATNTSFSVTTSINAPQITGHSTTEAITTYLKTLGNVKSISVKNVDTYQSDVFAYATFNELNTRYEALFYLQKRNQEYIVIDEDTAKIQAVPGTKYTFHELGGTTRSTPVRPYTITGGIVEDPNVHTVQIVLPNSVQLQPINANEKTYFNVQLGNSTNQIQHIDFLSSSGRVIYKRNLMI
ncbi:hypothetical protein [Alicyclobacillus fastidiosus]|uniref:Uncharacterized protein n=1 Tax=Alicyclobacillus fastidiosus TaxID=392011 RepID=A0ABV5AM68_9BACL|nr:hypothetical protein [Alicyclobacillus fastidiosus]WEH11075.1 hypothetical protein PYS47_07615 [Alicyclobacillus fastidiosus]